MFSRSQTLVRFSLNHKACTLPRFSDTQTCRCCFSFVKKSSTYSSTSKSTKQVASSPSNYTSPPWAAVPLSKSSETRLYTFSKDGKKYTSTSHLSDPENIIIETQPDTNSVGAKLKRATAQYGIVVPVFHISLALTWLGVTYFAVSQGLDTVALMQKLGFLEVADSVQARIAGGASTFVIAYAIHKCFAMVRIGITLVTVPVLVRHLRKIGVMKRN